MFKLNYLEQYQKGVACGLDEKTITPLYQLRKKETTLFKTQGYKSYLGHCILLEKEKLNNYGVTRGKYNDTFMEIVSLF